MDKGIVIGLSCFILYFLDFMRAIFELINSLFSQVPTCVDFRERGKPEYPEKNPRSNGDN